MPVPGYIRVAQVVVEILVPTAGVTPPPVPVVADTIIQLIGWKLYPNVPCEDALPGLELPPVKRAV